MRHQSAIVEETSHEEKIDYVDSDATQSETTTIATLQSTPIDNAVEEGSEIVQKATMQPYVEVAPVASRPRTFKFFRVIQVSKPTIAQEDSAATAAATMPSTARAEGTMEDETTVARSTVQRELRKGGVGVWAE